METPMTTPTQATPTTSNLSRRKALALGAAACASALFAAPTGAQALTKATAEALVNSTVADINKVINSGKSESRMIKDFEKILVRYGDVNIIARTTLGRDWRGLSSAEQRNFTKAFQGYIARKYGKRFREFIGGRIDVKGTKKVKSWHEVQTLAILAGEAPFDLTFLVSDRSGAPKFFDLRIEGISLRRTEGAEIGAMLDKRGGKINKLIADLKKAG